MYGSVPVSASYIHKPANVSSLWWRSESWHYAINCLASIKLCIGLHPFSLQKWFGLFHSSNMAGCSYILLILVRPAAYFPWVFKCNFMCELVVVRLWKTDILTVHRCANSGELTHTHNSHAHKLTWTQTNTFTVFVCNVCSPVMYYSKYVALRLIHLLRFRGKELKLADIQKLHTAPE